MIDRFLVHDARQIASLIPNSRAVVDLTVTSPPYWNLKDYGVPDQMGYGQSRRQFDRDMQDVLQQLFDITKDTGSLWLVVDTFRKKGVLSLFPFELAQAASSAGWQPRETIVWDKQHSVPWTQKGQLRNVLEYILVFSKTSRYKYYVDRIRTLDELSKWWVDFPERFHPKGKVPSNIWHFPIRTQGAWNRNAQLRHVCPFPTALAARIIEVATDPEDIVLDPFAGSGVALAQAELMGRHFIGLDINPEYANMYEAVVRDEVAHDWEELQRRREIAGQAHRDFERTIMRLRALKYCRKVANAFLGGLHALAGRQWDPRAVICLARIPRAYSHQRRLPTNVLIVMDGQREAARFALAKAEAAMAQVPLSHFGIEGSVEVRSSSEVEGHLGPRRRFYLYPRRKPRRHHGCATLSTWLHTDRLETGSPGQVPMLANFPVDVAWVLAE